MNICPSVTFIDVGIGFCALVNIRTLSILVGYLNTVNQSLTSAEELPAILRKLELLKLGKL